jgi:SAM-dependent methyltransferase
MHGDLTNLSQANTAHVVESYSKAEELQPAETYLFDKYVKPGVDVVDLGVGGGRTTPFLAKTARRYLGIDYSEAMVAACRSKFPQLDFVCADACDLSCVDDDSFDVAVFSFNGVDWIPSDEGRRRCLAELRRILRPGGVVILSSHNAEVLVATPDLRGAKGARYLWRLAYAAYRSLGVMRRTVFSRAFYEGSGYIFDPTHGGIHTHVSTPQSIARDAESAGLELVESVDYKMESDCKYLVGWYYYVLRKSA